MSKTTLMIALFSVVALSLSACEGVKKSSVVKLNTGGVAYDVDLTPHDKSDN
jgi:hypothetical protein